MMKIVLTKHVRKRMRERGIPPASVKIALLRPDVRLRRADGRSVVVKFIQGRTLEVVYVVETSDYIIITVYYAD